MLLGTSSNRQISALSYLAGVIFSVVLAVEDTTLLARNTIPLAVSFVKNLVSGADESLAMRSEFPEVWSHRQPVLASRHQTLYWKFQNELLRFDLFVSEVVAVVSVTFDLKPIHFKL